MKDPSLYGKKLKMEIPEGGIVRAYA